MLHNINPILPGLFNPNGTSNSTQLAFKVRYEPIRIDGWIKDAWKGTELGRSGLITYRAVHIKTKEHILSQCNETLTELNCYKIHWANNNIPTELEWMKHSMSYKFRCEFRIVRISGQIEYIVILSSL